MSITQLGFEVVQKLYQALPATVASAWITYGAARYISWLNLPPQESAKFAAILATAFMILSHLSAKLGHSGSESKLKPDLPTLTLGALVTYELYSRVNPVPGIWPFVKLCSVAFGSFIAVAFVTA